jgi:hypothetical protein
MSKTSKHKATLLRAMQERGRITAGEFLISNGNQFLKELRDSGVCESAWDEDGRRFKWTWIKQGQEDRVSNFGRSGHSTRTKDKK